MSGYPRKLRQLNTWGFVAARSIKGTFTMAYTGMMPEALKKVPLILFNLNAIRG